MVTTSKPLLRSIPSSSFLSRQCQHLTSPLELFIYILHIHCHYIYSDSFLFYTIVEHHGLGPSAELCQCHGLDTSPWAPFRLRTRQTKWNMWLDYPSHILGNSHELKGWDQRFTGFKISNTTPASSSFFPFPPIWRPRHSTAFSLWRCPVYALLGFVFSVPNGIPDLQPVAWGTPISGPGVGWSKCWRLLLIHFHHQRPKTRINGHMTHVAMFNSH